MLSTLHKKKMFTQNFMRLIRCLFNQYIYSFHFQVIIHRIFLSRKLKESKEKHEMENAKLLEQLAAQDKILKKHEDVNKI